MSLLDQLKVMSAHACDVLKGIAEAAGAEARVSVVVTHPGTVEDSFTVGDHDLDDLFAVLSRLATGERVECDVTSTHVGPNEPAKRGNVQ
jgi:hypothetical protein